MQLFPFSGQPDVFFLRRNGERVRLSRVDLQLDSGQRRLVADRVGRIERCRPGVCIICRCGQCGKHIEDGEPHHRGPAFTVTQSGSVGSFSISASAGSGGTISPSGTSSVSSGGSKTYTISPKYGYGISSVQVDGVGVGAVSTYAFKSVTANHNIKALFKKKRLLGLVVRKAAVPRS